MNAEKPYPRHYDHGDLFSYVICYQPEDDMYWAMAFEHHGEVDDSTRLFPTWEEAVKDIKAKLDKRWGKKGKVP